VEARFPTTKGSSVTLQDHRVVLLGGTSGIGLATAQLAAAQGATVIVASSNPESVKAALGALPASAAGEAVDLTDPAAVRAFFAGLDPFDHLVYTAGEALTFLEVGSMDLAQARQAFELRYFGGLSMEEIAKVLQISEVTVRRDWSTAKVWLYRDLRGTSMASANGR